jgi:ribosomal protein S18 acetylase RimI-like enzyme
VNLKSLVKNAVFRLLGKDPEAVVVSFLTGDPALASRMVEEIESITPDRRHYTVKPEPGSAWTLYRALRRRFRGLRIGLAPALFTGEPEHRALRLAAFLLAPRKVLAYNSRLERHHLRARTWIASWLFWRGVPLDRVFLRPWWWLGRRERTTEPEGFRTLDGRPFSPARRRVAVLSPYPPYPLAHGGAVRIYHLLREMAREFDIVLFAFTEVGQEEEHGPTLDLCAKLVLVEKPRYREPRWSSLAPPEVREYRSATMRRLWDGLTRELDVAVRQVEYTQLAAYGGDVLVEHDVTFDLYRQVLAQKRTLGAWWDWWRWRRFETKAVTRFRRAIVMSEKDAALLGGPNVRAIPNGVDLARFRPALEGPGERLLFIGSFRHFPNVVAYRFFVEEVWPKIEAAFPGMTLTAVAGPDPVLYWRAAAGSLAPPANPRIEMLGFVRDVQPLYVDANLVIVPTLVSAGTNLKVLEAMAMERAVVSTPSGCAGLGLEHGKSVWIAETAEEFAQGVATLLESPGLRRKIAAAARRIAEERFDWRALGVEQRAILAELAASSVSIRPAAPTDVPDLDRIQNASPEAVLWEPHSYLEYDCRVAEVGGRIAGFVVCRTVSEGESEVLSLVVDPGLRRRGIGRRLMLDALDRIPGSWFLEVRESNAPAIKLYKLLDFQEVARRPKYYQDTGETAVVMRRLSC